MINTREVAAPCHTEKNFTPEKFKELVDTCVRRIGEIRAKHPEIEALAACGHSGMMLMGALSYLTGLPQIAIRKTKDTYHDSHMANGWMGCKGYLIIDDLVSSGTTLEKIISRIDKEAADLRSNWGVELAHLNPRPVAVLLYDTYYQQAALIGWQGRELMLPMYVTGSRSLDMDASAGAPRTLPSWYDLPPKDEPVEKPMKRKVVSKYYLENFQEPAEPRPEPEQQKKAELSISDLYVAPQPQRKGPPAFLNDGKVRPQKKRPNFAAYF